MHQNINATKHKQATRLVRYWRYSAGCRRRSTKSMSAHRTLIHPRGSENTTTCEFCGTPPFRQLRDLYDQKPGCLVEPSSSATTALPGGQRSILNKKKHKKHMRYSDSQENNRNQKPGGLIDSSSSVIRVACGKYTR